MGGDGRRGCEERELLVERVLDHSQKRQGRYKENACGGKEFTSNHWDEKQYSLLKNGGSACQIAKKLMELEYDSAQARQFTVEKVAKSRHTRLRWW